MDCVTIRPGLLAYHLGICDDDERERMGAHLLGCQACLRAYLAIKRAAEVLPPDAGEGAPRPSQAARLRLRAEVARSFRRTPARRLRGLLGRPVPLYQAAAALLLLLLGLLPVLSRSAPPGTEVAGRRLEGPMPARAPRSRRPLEAREVIDTSRPEAVSQHIL